MLFKHHLSSHDTKGMWLKIWQYIFASNTRYFITHLFSRRRFPLHFSVDGTLLRRYRCHLPHTQLWMLLSRQQSLRINEFGHGHIEDVVFYVPSNFPPWARHKVSEHVSAKIRVRTSSERVCMSRSRLIDLISVSSFTASIKASRQPDNVVFPSGISSRMQTDTCSTKRGAICLNFSLRQKARTVHLWQWVKTAGKYALTSFVWIKAFC